MNYQQTNTRKGNRGLRVLLSVALCVMALLSVLAISVSANGATAEKITVEVADLSIGTDSGLVLDGDGFRKTYDGVTAIDGITVAEQPDFSDKDVTLAVDKAEFDNGNVDAGERTLVVSFKLEGADAAQFAEALPDPISIPVLIEPKELTWAEETVGTGTILYVPGQTLYTEICVALPGIDRLVGVVEADLADLAFAGADGYTVSVNATDAGDYTAQLAVEVNNANYTVAPLTVEVEISKKITMSVADLSIGTDSGLVLDGGVLRKTYDGVATVNGITVAKQPNFSGKDVTLAVDKAEFYNGNVNVGERALVVSFKLEGADAALFADALPNAVSIPVLIEPKELTWAEGAAGTGTTMYVPGQTLYTGISATLPGIDQLVGVVEADLADLAFVGADGYTVAINAAGAGDYTVQLAVEVNNANYTVAPLTVAVAVAKAQIVDVEWRLDGEVVTAPTFIYGDAAANALVAIGRDAAQNYYTLSVVYPNGYGAANAAKYVLTAVPLDAANIEIATDAASIEVKIDPATCIVWMDNVTHRGDGIVKYDIAVNGAKLPADALDGVVYKNKATGEVFAPTAAYGNYNVVAILPEGGNYVYVDKNGNPVTTLEAKLCINRTYLASTDLDGDAYNIIVIGENGFSADIVANLSIPESLGKAVSGMRIHKAYSLTLSNVTSANSFTLLVSTYENLLHKNCDALTVNDLYIYDSATQKLVPANTKYTVQLKDGYYEVDGYTGGDTTTFVIAPVYHTPFLLTAPGISLLILLVIAVLVLAFFIGLALLRAIRGVNVPQVIDTEGDAPEVVPATAEDVAEEDALDAMADELADSILPEEEEAVDPALVEAEKNEALAEMLEEASKVVLDGDGGVAEAYADSVADELRETVDAADEELEADPDALQAAIEAAMADALNESADAEDAVEIVEEEEAPVTEEAVEAFAVVDEDAEADDDDDDDEEEDDDSFGGFGGFGDLKLRYIDIKAQPDEYAALLEQEAAGEIRIVYKLKKSFQSRLIQSQGNVQLYYSAIKNALLSYKGNKNRISWNYEAFNKGRIHVAKINAKLKTLYLYLALDPEELQDTKYGVIDVSSKKKYATVPVLMKIKGDRKFKYAIELIEKLCGEQMTLPKLELEPTDYTLEYKTTDELIEEGIIKKLAAGVPIAYFEDAPAVEEAPAIEVPVAEPAIEAVPVVEEAVEVIAEAPAEEVEKTEE